MIKSMTGFGKGESKAKFGIFVVEIRTVNHRFFDVSSRIPNSLSQFEDSIKKYLHRYIKRGRVNFSLSHRKTGEGVDSIRLNDEAIEKYYKMLRKIKRKYKLKDDVKLSHIFSFPDVVIQEQPEYDAGSIWPVLEGAIKKAVLNCDKMRKTEGEALYKDLMGRVHKVSNSLDKISMLGPKLISGYKYKLDARIKDILKHRDYNIDRSRLETELALFAKQCDISEEITRARSHLGALKIALASAKETGRKIDFILQELQREINTLGSKAADVNISQLAIDIKTEIEKMREQAQNVE